MNAVEALRWNDAYTSDESARQDKLVEVENARKGPKCALTVFFVCLTLAAVFFWQNNKWAGTAFLPLPVLTFITQLVAAVRSHSSRDPSPLARQPPHDAGEDE